MDIKKVEFFKDVLISYSDHKRKFYSQAELHIDGFDLKIKAKYFDTINEAVSSIKERICEASLKFKSSSESK